MQDLSLNEILPEARNDGVFPQHTTTERGDAEVPCRLYQPAHWTKAGFQTPVTLSNEVVCVSCYSNLLLKLSSSAQRSENTFCYLPENQEIHVLPKLCTAN